MFQNRIESFICHKNYAQTNEIEKKKRKKTQQLPDQFVVFFHSINKYSVGFVDFILYL